MKDRSEPLAMLYGRFDDIANRRASGNSSAAHQAVLNRLAANRKLAEACGWSACELERQGGSGRLRLWGTPPSSATREVVPDLAVGLETESPPDAERPVEPDPAEGGRARATPPPRPVLAGTRLLGADVTWGVER